MGILPVVVRDERGSLGIFQLEERIGQGASDTELGQRRPDRADDDTLGLVAAHNVTGDQDILALVNATASRNVG